MLASRDWTNEILDEGRLSMSRLAAEVDAADPHRLVLSRSRLLCAGLARLATEVGAALGAAGRERSIADLAAAVSLLTKIDDEVIDSPAFHGGRTTPRVEVARRTCAFLAPTLASMRAAAPATSEPRCVFAAGIGRRIRALAGSAERADALLDLLAQGWDTQVDAVVTLTGDPSRVDQVELDRVTRRISGDWLAIIAACGSLPGEAARWLTADEIEAIRDAGLYIQRADSLCDLEKDREQGLTSTWAAVTATRAENREPPSVAALYAAVHRASIDADSIPSAAKRAAIARRLASLGDVASLLDWIRRMLLARYLAHPLTRTGRRAIVRSAASTEAPCSGR